MVVSIDHNVPQVVTSVDDVKDDLRKELHKRVGAAMDMLYRDAAHYILDDADWSGQLYHALSQDTDDLEWSVGVDMGLAEYAAIVEFGSGKRTNLAHEDSAKHGLQMGDSGSAVPVGFPFESPDIDYNDQDPTETEGYETFYGFVKYIEEWMRSKPVEPKLGDYFVSAAYIAASIVEQGNYAHPYLRPAWFDNEYEIRRAARNALKNAVR
jgi:hypothetical protein